MMKNKITTRVLAALLALLMLPAFSASAAGEATLVRADAVGVFSGAEKNVFLLESGDRYYISPTEAGTLTGLHSAPAISGVTEFFGDHLRYRPELSGIESVSYKDDTYYALEPLMDALETYVFSNGNGYLYYNSVPENTELLLGETDRIMATEYYSADLLEELGALADGAYAVAVVADIINHQRFDALWGKAYSDDMKGLFTELIQPIDDDTNIFTSIKTVGDKVDMAAEAILEFQEGVDTFKEKNLDIPAGGDILLFGFEGTATLRETLEAEQAVSKADFFDFYLKSRLGYAGALEYEESVKDLKGEYSTDLSIFGLSDLVDIGESIVATTRVSEEYALALDEVLDDIRYSGKEGFWGTVERSVLCGLAEEVLDDYWAYRDQNMPALIADFTGEMVWAASSNTLESILKKAILGKGSLLISISKGVFDVTLGASKREDAVRNMYMFMQIQSLFQKCYDWTEEDGVDTGDAVLLKDAAVLYLKSAWHAYDAFSFDDGDAALIDRLFQSPGTPTTYMKGILQDELLKLEAFPEEMFQVVENQTAYAAGTFGRAYSAGESDTPYDAYLQLLQNYEWLKYAEPEFGEVSPADYALYDGIFCIYDIDKDGTEELIILAGRELPEGTCIVFTYRDGEAVCVGCTFASLLSGPMGRSVEAGLVLSEYSGGLVCNTWLGIDDDALVQEDEECFDYDAGERSSFGDSWLPLETFSIGDAAVLENWDPAEHALQKDDDAIPADGGENDSFAVDCLDGRITLTFPSSWAGHYKIEENETRSSVYNLENFEADENLGLLFSVSFSDLQNEKDLEACGYPDARSIGQWSGGLVVAMLPSDVCFDTEDSALTDAYMSMSGDVDTVLSTIRINE